jgi:hypothetical protein
MTGTNCDLFYTQIVPVIFEPPCISEENFASIFRVTESACIWSSSTAQRSRRKRHSPKTVQSCPHEVTLPSICPHTHTLTETHTHKGFSCFNAHPLDPRKGPHVHIKPVQCFTVLTVLKPWKDNSLALFSNFACHNFIGWDKIYLLFLSMNLTGHIPYKPPI